MMKPSLLRTLFAALIGVFAGGSLTTGVLPFVLSTLFDLNSFELLIEIRSLVFPVIIFWAICGGWLGMKGGAQTGGLIFGLCGALSSLFLSVLTFAGIISITLVAILTGFIYGGIGGLILGRAFPTTVEDMS